MSAGRRFASRPPVAVAVVVVTIAYAAVMAYLLQSPYDVAGGIAIAHVVALGGYGLVRLTTRREPREIQQLVVAAFALKELSSLVRYGVAFDVYGGVADAAAYHTAGATIASQLRDGVLSSEITSNLVGTNFIKLLTGVVYVVTGPTKIGGFLLFSVLGFLGLLAFYKAFRIALPDGDHVKYGRLVLLMPSLLFWPSSIGKDAWMMLMLGVSALGVAKLARGQSGSARCLIGGLAGTAVVRPHITLALIAATLVGYVISMSVASSADRGSEPAGAATGGGRVRVVSLVIIVVAGAIALGQVQAYFKLDTVDLQSVEATLDATSERTGQGGSSFAAPSARTLPEVPAAVFAVLFRPLIFEARSAQTVIASLEGSFLLFLLVLARRSLRELPRLARQNAYVATAACYTIVFCIAFSNFGNFGLLARQRVQVLPFVLLFVALPAARMPRSASRDVSYQDGSQSAQERELAQAAPGSG